MTLPAERVLPPTLLDRARALELWLQHAVRARAPGRHRARHLGGGGEFAEHREYRYGDELRHIDWKAAARTDRLVVRQFESDRRADIHLVLDRSASMSFGTTGGAEAPWGGPWPSTKWELGRLLSLSLGFVFLRGGDRLGLSIADGSSSQSSPLLSGQRQLLQLADRILDRPPNGSGDLHAVLRTLAFGPRRNLLVVVSDLLLEDSILPLLEQHRAAGAEVWVFHLVDPAEIEFPYEEPTRFVDLETSAEAGLNPRDFARTYRAEFGAFLERQEEECRRGGIHYRRIRGDDRFDEILVEFLSR